MTYQGAIDELKSLENNSSMPDWFKPTIKKVRETMEMDGRENIHGEWIFSDECREHGYCSICGYGSIDLVVRRERFYCTECRSQRSA